MSGDNRQEAFALYQAGLKLVDIAKQLDVPAGTVRRWKHSDGWDTGGKSERKKANANAQKANVPTRRKRILPEAKKLAENAVLNDKQQLFCVYYAKYFNATKAYQKAYGCAYSTAVGQGFRLLDNPAIREEITTLKATRFSRVLIQPEDIFQKYLDIAFADMDDFLSFGQEEVEVMGAFGPVTVEDPDTGEKVPLTKIVNTVKFRESSDVDTSLVSEVKGGRSPSIKLNDRMKALEWLAEHMDLATDEQRARVAKLQAEAERIRRDGSTDDDDGVVIINDAPE